MRSAEIHTAADSKNFKTAIKTYICESHANELSSYRLDPNLLFVPMGIGL